MNHDNSSSMSEARRMEIFRALVEAQDGAMSVTQSRQSISRQFELTEDEVRQIEREGLNKQWPPL